MFNRVSKVFNIFADLMLFGRFGPAPFIFLMIFVLVGLPLFGIHLDPPDDLDTSYTVTTKDGIVLQTKVHALYYGRQPCIRTVLAEATQKVVATMSYEEIKSGLGNEYRGLREKVMPVLTNETKASTICAGGSYVFAGNYWYSFTEGG